MGWNGFVRGIYEKEHGGKIIIYADELYKNNTPYVDFCHFCMLRNLLVPATEDYLFLNPELPPDSMMFLVEYVYIIKSDDEERNQIIDEMLYKYVPSHTMFEKDYFELFYSCCYDLDKIKP